jgi:hypothetical protein
MIVNVVIVGSFVIFVDGDILIFILIVLIATFVELRLTPIPLLDFCFRLDSLVLMMLMVLMVVVVPSGLQFDLHSSLRLRRSSRRSRTGQAFPLQTSSLLSLYGVGSDRRRGRGGGGHGYGDGIGFLLQRRPRPPCCTGMQGMDGSSDVRSGLGLRG